MANESIVETPVVETPVVDTPAVETPAEEVVLLGDDAPESAETPEQKTARETTEADTTAENKRLLETDDKTLKPEELAKKQELVKAEKDAKDAEAAAKANEVPGKYDIKIDGVELDAKMIEGLSPVFKDLKLTNLQVQKLAEAYAPIIKSQIEAQQQEAIALWNKQGDDWKAESVKMLGANAKTDMAFAAKFMDRFGGKEIVGTDGKKSNELRALMQETKIGNNPVMLKAIIEAGKLLGQDKFVEGSNGTGDKEPSLYDHPKSKATLK